MKIHYALPALFLAGCASQPQAVDTAPESLPAKLDPIVDESQTASVRLPEQLKAYPVGRYEDPDTPSVMHEGHTIYRAETSPDWNLAPNAPTSLPLGPTVAVADPAQEHTTLTAELEQRVKQEDQLLQTTYEQNQRLSDEISKLEAAMPHPRLPDPSDESAPTAAHPPQTLLASPQPQAPASPPPPPLNSAPVAPQGWWQWLGFQNASPQSTPKGK